VSPVPNGSTPVPTNNIETCFYSSFLGLPPEFHQSLAMSTTIPLNHNLLHRIVYVIQQLPGFTYFSLQKLTPTLPIWSSLKAILF